MHKARAGGGQKRKQQPGSDVQEHYPEDGAWELGPGGCMQSWQVCSGNWPRSGRAQASRRECQERSDRRFRRAG